MTDKNLANGVCSISEFFKTERFDYIRPWNPTDQYYDFGFSFSPHYFCPVGGLIISKPNLNFYLSNVRSLLTPQNNGLNNGLMDADVQIHFKERTPAVFLGVHFMNEAFRFLTLPKVSIVNLVLKPATGEIAFFTNLDIMNSHFCPVEVSSNNM